MLFLDNTVPFGKPNKLLQSAKACTFCYGHLQISLKIKYACILQQGNNSNCKATHLHLCSFIQLLIQVIEYIELPLNGMENQSELVTMVTLTENTTKLIKTIDHDGREEQYTTLAFTPVSQQQWRSEATVNTHSHTFTTSTKSTLGANTHLENQAGAAPCHHRQVM